ncbi:MAG: DNA repair protein RecO [Fibrobacteria bacterium]|nr:DNA repair protein RecO [Fibrobacteria bacterium]
MASGLTLPQVTTRAIVLRRIPFGETSWILHTLTEDDGPMGILAKGARRKGSPLASALEPLTVSEMVVSVRPGRELQNLVNASPLSAHEGLSIDLERHATALACSEVALRFLRESGPVPPVFRELSMALDHLHEGRPCRAVHHRFLASFAEELGWGLAMDHCAQCGNPDVLQSHSVSSSAGGVLCPACARASHVDQLPRDTWELLRAAVLDLPTPGADGGDWDRVEDVLYDHICRHAGGRPRLDALEFLRTARA